MFRDDLADFCGADTQQAYRHLFNMENYLRFVAKWELAAAHGADWKSALGEVGVKALEQMEKDAQLGLIDVERRNVMSYLMLSQLQTVIIRNDNWDLFSRKLGNKEILQSQFQILNRLRGKAMHCRPWSAEDLATLENALALLARLTLSYRAERLDADVEENPAFRRLPTPLRAHVRRIGDEARAPARRRWLVRAYSRVGGYDKVSLALRGGGFADDAPQRALLTTGLDCFFAAADSQTGRLDLYLPKGLESEDVRRILVAVDAIVPLDGSVPHDANPAQVERLDGLFRLPVDLPPPMRLPGTGG